MSIIGIDRAKVGKLQDLNKMYNQTKKSYKFCTKVEKLQNLNNDQNVTNSEQRSNSVQIMLKLWTKLEMLKDLSKMCKLNT